MTQEYTEKFGNIFVTNKLVTCFLRVMVSLLAGHNVGQICLPSIIKFTCNWHSNETVTLRKILLYIKTRESGWETLTENVRVVAIKLL